jgi:hypothetical protein
MIKVSNIVFPGSKSNIELINYSMPGIRGRGSRENLAESIFSGCSSPVPFKSPVISSE